MDGYAIISLREMIHQIGENRVKTILSNFSCPLNPDVEKFLKSSAITFALQSIAPTHMVFSSYRGSIELVGYFTISLKSFFISKKSLSNNMRKRITKFGTYDSELNGYKIPAPLIAQLGKNYNNGLNKLISGDELLKFACDKIAMVQQQIGGKVVYIECEDKPKLISFYTTNGFVSFGKRVLDKDEKNDLCGDYVIQMLKIIKPDEE